MIPPSVLALKALFHSRKISMDRKFSENIIVKSWKFSTEKLFSDGKFVSANHILQNVLSAENFPEWKWALRDLILFHSIRFCDLWHWVWYKQFGRQRFINNIPDELQTKVSTIFHPANCMTWRYFRKIKELLNGYVTNPNPNPNRNPNPDPNRINKKNTKMDGKKCQPQTNGKQCFNFCVNDYLYIINFNSILLVCNCYIK
jgi:hypothetical protein